MKKILIIAHYVDDFDYNGNNRFNYIADQLAQRHSVEMITSDFSHIRKRKRESKFNNNFEVKLIKEPSYKKNVSLKRLYSHNLMAKNLKKYLRKIEQPDFIYCAVPSLSVAKVATDYAIKRNVEMIIDVQDLWPEAYRMVLGDNRLTKISMYPFAKIADYIYSNADTIVAVSKTYLQRVASVNKKSNRNIVAYIGTDLTKFDSYVEKNKVDRDDLITICYIGTLGESYDLKLVMDSIKGLKNVKFLIMGDGPLQEEFENYAENNSISVEFTGRLPYQEMVKKLSESDIAINPIKPGSAASIINKVADYAAAGLPVVNTQDCSEYINLLESYRAGISILSNNSLHIKEAIVYLIENEETRKTMSRNSRKLAEERFDRNTEYKKIFKIFE